MGTPPHPPGQRFPTERFLSVLHQPQYDTLKYQPLQKLKEDFAIGDGCGPVGANQWAVAIASDDAGNFLCAWLDERTGRRQIDAQLFDPQGNRKGGLIHVSESTNEWNSEPNIAFNPVSGEYIVLWAESGYDIRFQRLSSTGEKVGQNSFANQNYLVNTNNPSAAVDSSGNYIVTWVAETDTRYRYNPFCRVLDASGVPLTNQWSLVPEGGNGYSGGWEPRIAADSAGRCVVVWAHRVGAHWRIALQVVSLAGNHLPSPLIVSDTLDSEDDNFPTIAGTRDGHFLILYQSGKGVSGRIYQLDNGFVSPQFLYHATNDWTMSAVSSNGRDRFYGVTTNSLRAHTKVMTVHGDSVGGGLVSNETSTGGGYYYPRLPDARGDCLYLAYWTYERNQQDVLLQPLDLMMRPVGSRSRITDDGCSASQVAPTVKMNKNGYSLVVWEDRRNGAPDLYGRVLNGAGTPIGEEFPVSDTALYHFPANVAIEGMENGEFLVAFSAGNYSEGNVILQRVDPIVKKIGANSRITDDHNARHKVAVAKDDNGETLVCWFNQNSRLATVWAQRFRADLSMGSGFRVFGSGDPSGPKLVEAIAANRHHDLFILWRDYSLSTYSPGTVLKGMIFDRQGRSVTDTLRLDTLASSSDIPSIEARLDEERNFAFVRYSWGELTLVRRYTGAWGSFRSSIELYTWYPELQILRFEAHQLLAAWSTGSVVRGVSFDDGNRTLTPMMFQVFGSSPNFDSPLRFSADLSKDHLLFTYCDIRDSEKGYDVYANLQLLPAGVATPSSRFYIERKIELFPNPVAGTLSVQLDVAAPNIITLSVYNILGQKVSEVEALAADAGPRLVSIDTRRLPSGVYFLRYHGFGVQNRKFIVVK